jgi:hypothetical protein
MNPVIDVGSAHPPRQAARQCTQQGGRVNTTAEGDQQAHIRIARQKLRQVICQPLRTELLPRDSQSELSENTPKDAIRAERAARSSSRGSASS